MNSKIITMIATVSVVLMLSMVAVNLSPFNMAFAKLPTTLSLSTYPKTYITNPETHTKHVTMTGILSSDGQNIAGATITISGTGEGTKTVKTDNLGYIYGTNLDVGKHTMKASFAGDSNHEPSSSTTFTVTVNAPPAG